MQPRSTSLQQQLAYNVSVSINVSFTVSHTHAHTRAFNGSFSGTTQVSRYQKDKTNLEFTEVRDSEWQHPPLGFLQAGCPSCRPTTVSKHCRQCQCHSTVT